jgi:hypothetical protein
MTQQYQSGYLYIFSQAIQFTDLKSEKRPVIYIVFCYNSNNYCYEIEKIKKIAEFYKLKLAFLHLLCYFLLYIDSFNVDNVCLNGVLPIKSFN